MLVGNDGKPDLALQSRRSPILAFSTAVDNVMQHDTKKDDGSPKFGKLLLVLVGAVVFCGLLTWIMGTYFPHFPS